MKRAARNEGRSGPVEGWTPCSFGSGWSLKGLTTDCHTIERFSSNVMVGYTWYSLSLSVWLQTKESIAASPVRFAYYFLQARLSNAVYCLQGAAFVSLNTPSFIMYLTISKYSDSRAARAQFYLRSKRVRNLVSKSCKYRATISRTM